MGRWEKWRPSIALCQHEDFLVDRFELLYSAPHQSLGEQLAADIHQVSPETDLRSVLLDLHDPWNFEEVYAALHEYVRGYAFALDQENYQLAGDFIEVNCATLRGESAMSALFAVSMKRRRSTNDTDRLRKYLARFGLDWQKLHETVTT